jgi:hypothetical protein
LNILTARKVTLPWPLGRIMESGLCVENAKKDLGNVGVCIALALIVATHLQLVPRSRKCASIHPLPHTSSWRAAVELSSGTTLTLQAYC